MRIKPFLIWFQIVSSSGPGRDQPPILDLIGHGKFIHDTEVCSPPEISQSVKLYDEVNKDCEYFGKILFHVDNIYLFLK